MAEQLDFEVIRERIKLLLERKNWTDYVLASHCGVPYATIWRFMNRRHKTIEYDNLVKIARAFDRVSSQLTGELPLDRSDAEIAVSKDAKIAAAAVAMTNMAEETKAQYVKIGHSLAEPAGETNKNH